MNSETLKQLRLHYELTQQKMAEIVGVHPVQICRWEKERKQLRDKRLRGFIEKLKEEFGDER